MANLQREVERARQMVTRYQKRACTVTPEGALAARAMIEPDYEFPHHEARKAFEHVANSR